MNSKLGKDNLYNLWYEFKRIHDIENIDKIFLIFDINRLNQQPMNLLIPETIAWCPVHQDPCHDYKFFSSIDKFICPSLWGRNVINNTLSNTYYVPHVVDYYELCNIKKKQICRETRNIPKDAFCVLVVARNGHTDYLRKNFQGIYKVLLELEKKIKNLHFLIHSNFNESGFDMNLFLVKRNVTFSHISSHQHKLNEIYLCSDVLLCMSCSEGFGLPIVEAQLCGIPVVGTNCTSISENIINGLLIKSIPCKGQYLYGWSEPSINDAVIKIIKIYEKTEEERILEGNRSRDILHNRVNMCNVKQKLHEIIECKIKCDALFYNVTEDKTKTNDIITTYKENYYHLCLIVTNSLHIQNIYIPDEVFILTINLDDKQHNNAINKANIFFHTKQCFDYLIETKRLHANSSVNYNDTKINIHTYENSCFMIDNMRLGEIYFINHIHKCKSLIKNYNCRSINPIHECTRSLLFIDDRCDNTIEFHFLNMIKFTTEDIGFQVMCKEKNYNFIMDIINKNNLKNIHISILESEINSINLLDKFMFSQEFYDKVVTEKVFIFQLDSLLLQPLNNKFWDYDWIGAPWKKGCILGGNGGFNIRSISKCEKIAKKYNYNFDNINLSTEFSDILIKEDYPHNEDTLYCIHLKNQDNIALPSYEESSLFSIEISEEISNHTWKTCNNKIYGFHKLYMYATISYFGEFLDFHKQNLSI
jgi:glycosyltransferase involved in cell wall biosynthesis